MSLLDVAPTILELTGSPALAGIEGRSLLAALDGGLTPRPTFAQSVQYGRGVRSVVDGSFKLIYENRAGTYELFDLVDDPSEQHVVTDENPDVARRLARELGVPDP